MKPTGALGHGSLHAELDLRLTDQCQLERRWCDAGVPAVRGDRPHATVKRPQTQRPLSLPEPHLDGAGRCWGMNDPSALWSGLQLQTTPPRQSADHPGCQETSDTCQQDRRIVSRRSRTRRHRPAHSPQGSAVELVQLMARPAAQLGPRARVPLSSGRC